MSCSFHETAAVHSFLSQTAAVHNSYMPRLQVFLAFSFYRVPCWCLGRLKRNWFYDVKKNYDKKRLKKGGRDKEDNKRTKGQQKGCVKRKRQKKASLVLLFYCKTV
jgi:hypothetical protein